MSEVPLVEVTNLRKVFAARGVKGRGQGFVAVDDVSFEIPHGGSLAIVGESGSGKTTTARIVAGLETATSGTVAFEGRDRTIAGSGRSSRRLRAQEIQMVFQDPFSSLDPRQRVLASILEILSTHFDGDGPWRRQRAEQLLEQVGLEGSGNLLPRDLSGGQRQRVSIARALALNPKLLVLDEAVSALDVSIQAQVINLLVDIRAETGISYLFVSHDLAVVRQLCETCLVMRDGLVVESGRTSDVLGRPQADYTRALLAAVPGPGWSLTR